MVNNKKEYILNQLKQSAGWISGAELSRRLTISRVAVWKQIQSLIREDYPIESGPRGYRLNTEKEVLSPLEFSDREEILFFKELGSTMDEAQNQLQGERRESFTVIADHQSGGIGLNRSPWPSPSGGIYLSFVINRPAPLPEREAFRQKGITSALRALKELDLPEQELTRGEGGEILFRGRKIGGTLEEYRVRGEEMLWYVLGIGIQLNSSPAAPLYSLKDLTGRSYSRIDLIRKMQSLWEEEARPEETEKNIPNH